MTKTSASFDVFIPGFMLAVAFCFIVSTLFMVSGMTGEGMDKPFSLITAIVCR